MKKVHFFKAKSRIGIAYHDNPQDRHANIGVESGSDAILTRDFLVKFKQAPVSEYLFSLPEEIKREHFDKVLGKQINEFRIFINKHVRSGQAQVVVGGDHSITLPSVLAVRDRIGGFDNLGYVQFDSHGDMNTRESSPTGNFHGIYARALVERLDIPEIEELISEKLPAENIVYVGNLDLDPGEIELFSKKKIKTINQAELVANGAGTKRDFKNFVQSFKYLHVTFDIDVLNKIQASATGIPSENGPRLKDIAYFLSIIGKHPNLSIDLTEVNPRKSGLDETIQSAHKVLLTMLAS